jgi:2-dehydro-3-deoxygluconokinase
VDNSMGRRIVNVLRSQGVDVSGVVWKQEGRSGLYFIELGSAPRATKVIYDRARAAFSLLDKAEVNWSLLQGAQILHLTGITPALSQNCLELIELATDKAREFGLTLSFDVNYRARLWTPSEANHFLASYLPKVDVLFCSRRDAELIFGLEGTAEEILARFRDKFGNRVIVVTDEARGSVAGDGAETWSIQAPAVDVVDRIGAGDAFVAGFLYGWLTSGAETGLRYGTANAALKMTHFGDIAWTTREDLEAQINGSSLRVLR